MKKDHVSLQRRPLFTPIWLAALAALLVSSVALWLWSTARATTVVVVRHAEKQLAAGEDPALTDAGRARSELLARMFGAAAGPGRIDAIYVSGWQRTQQTAAPLAARLGLRPQILTIDDPRALARRLLRENIGRRVLLVWHGDVIPQVVGALSGRDDIPPIAADEYGTLYVVTVPAIGHGSVLRIAY